MCTMGRGGGGGGGGGGSDRQGQCAQGGRLGDRHGQDHMVCLPFWRGVVLRLVGECVAAGDVQVPAPDLGFPVGTVAL